MSTSVTFGDTALVALVLHATREVDGVVQLQQRPVAALVRRVARQRPDASAVELGRDPDGTLAVAIRIVSRLDPAPQRVVADVEKAVRDVLRMAGETRVQVEVTVADVRR